MEELYGDEVMTMDNEILGKCSELFIGIWI